MNISPVSFGSLMVFTLKDGKAKADVPVLMDIAFSNNPQLQDFELSDTVTFSEKIDGTVHNASKNFARSLDKLYRDKLKPNMVKLTEAEFYVNPKETVKKYFLTAANDKQEAKIHATLSKNNIGGIYCAKFDK